ncbi:MAG: TM2 domain-containing protein [Alphaproteobacteria bacterium]|nr:MAG: TM2 domain-containing protein [Alphaproteobacteria bacterium]
MQESLAGKIAEGIASQHKGPLKAATADAPAAYRTQAEALAARRLSWSPKSRLVALILCFMVGVFGVHRFYIGRWFTGIIYLLTLGLFGIGWLMDMILIPLGALTDGRNRPIRVWLPDDAPQTA